MNFGGDDSINNPMLHVVEQREEAHQMALNSKANEHPRRVTASMEAGTDFVGISFGCHFQPAVLLLEYPAKTAHLVWTSDVQPA